MKVTILGSGNWGSTVARIVGNNVAKYPKLFHKNVNMWVYEEMVDGKKLTEIINSTHENVKYLPGIKLPENVIAVPDAVEAAKDSSLLIFVIPHQFLKGLCNNLKGKVPKDAQGLSLIKGMDFNEEGPVLLSKMVKELMDVEMSVLMGANVANEIAQEKFSETTIGYAKGNAEKAELWKKLFDTEYFRVNCIQEVAGVEMCGALKNIVALAAGICDGLDTGSNTKAAFMRIGLAETRKFVRHFFKDVNQQVWFESCGIADLITTCLSGRNRKVAAAFAREKRPIAELEKELLGGQKLQGTLTLQEVHHILKKQQILAEYPLFATLFKIFFEGADVNTLFKY